MPANPTEFLRPCKVITISPGLFQTHMFTKTSVVLITDFIAANQIRERMPLIISQFNSSSEHGLVLGYTDHFPFQVVWNTGYLTHEWV